MQWTTLKNCTKDIKGNYLKINLELCSNSRNPLAGNDNQSMQHGLLSKIAAELQFS